MRWVLDVLFGRDIVKSFGVSCATACTVLPRNRECAKLVKQACSKVRVNVGAREKGVAGAEAFLFRRSQAGGWLVRSLASDVTHFIRGAMPALMHPLPLC